MSTSQETCLYESSRNLRGIGLVKIDVFSASRLSQHSFLRNVTGDFYLEKMEESDLKNIWKLWLTSVLAVFLLAACGGTAVEDKPKTEPAPQEDVSKEVEELYPLTIKDADGKEVTVEAAPATIVSLMPSNTEILFELGLVEEVIAVTDNDDYPAEVEEKESVGGFELNIEKIISLNPEMVFAHEMLLGSSGEGLEQIRDAGIPVIVVDNAEDFEETYATIEMIGQVTDKVDEATKIIEGMKAQVDEVVEKTAKAENERTVFVETSDAPEIYTPGSGTFVQEMLDMIGAKNMVAEEGWIMIDPEEIVNENPDVIVVMYNAPDIVQSVKNRAGFDTVTAVTDNMVIQVDENLTSRTGPRLADGLEEFAKAIYPEAFSE